MYNEIMDNFISYIYDNYNVEYNEETYIGNTPATIIADCFISKASYDFWYNAAINPENPWHDFLGDDRSWPGKIWHAIKVAAADTWAFVSTLSIDITTEGI